MKRTFFYIIVPLLVCACQKEIDNPNDNSANKLAKGNKLAQALSRNGNDSILVNYYYNSNNNLVGYSAVGRNNSGPIDISITWNRNASTIITSKILKSPAFVAIGIDSMVTSFGYNDKAKRYIYARTETKLNGFVFIDSTLYTYDGANKVVSAYHNMTIKGNTVPVERTEYSYAGNNLMTVGIISLMNYQKTTC